MKAGIIFTGTGPILIVSTYDGFEDPKFLEKLCAKGIKKFIASEISLEKVKEKYAKYGEHLSMVLGDLGEKDDLRVLDYNGHNVLENFSFAEMSRPIYYEP